MPIKRVDISHNPEIMVFSCFDTQLEDHPARRPLRDGAHDPLRQPPQRRHDGRDSGVVRCEQDGRRVRRAARAENPDDPNEPSEPVDPSNPNDPDNPGAGEDPDKPAGLTDPGRAARQARSPESQRTAGRPDRRHPATKTRPARRRRSACSAERPRSPGREPSPCGGRPTGRGRRAVGAHAVAVHGVPRTAAPRAARTAQHARTSGPGGTQPSVRPAVCFRSRFRPPRASLRPIRCSLKARSFRQSGFVLGLLRTPWCALYADNGVPKPCTIVTRRYLFQCHVPDSPIASRLARTPLLRNERESRQAIRPITVRNQNVPELQTTTVRASAWAEFRPMAQNPAAPLPPPDALPHPLDVERAVGKPLAHELLGQERVILVEERHLAAASMGSKSTSASSLTTSKNARSCGCDPGGDARPRGIEAFDAESLRTPQLEKALKRQKA